MTNEELQKEMIAAMKAKDKVRLSIIRQVKAEVKNIEVNERRDVTEEDVNSMIKRLIKQTSETLEMSIKAGTDQERTDNLTEQVKILESLLPAQVSGEELEALIEQVIAELGATSKKQMGQVMGALGKATQPGKLLPAEVNSSEVPFFLKKEQPKATTPPVNSKKTIISMICIQTEHLRFQLRTKRECLQRLAYLLAFRSIEAMERSRNKIITNAQ